MQDDAIQASAPGRDGARMFNDALRPGPDLARDARALGEALAAAAASQRESAAGRLVALARIRAASGIYRGRCDGRELELCLDTDPALPLARVSGDFHLLAGDSREHLTWFFARTSTVHIDTGMVFLRGVGRFSQRAAAPLFELSLPMDGSPPGVPVIHMQFLTPRHVRGARYRCVRVEALSHHPLAACT